ncbi:nickel-responsive transcriptional regulator NikR [bacterium]|nr:nickel-responsive transcriptional regulator NikR [bacterium]
MDELKRFGISIPGDLLSRFDELIERRGYSNRSEALRDLMREDLGRERVHSNQPVVGVISLVYDHHTRELTEKLTSLQHDHTESIISTMHVHLSHHDCLEVIVMRGRARQIEELADRMAAIKGVKFGRCVLAGMG